MNTLKHQRNEFTITVGKHTATVVCKNKRDGKQRASQAILQVFYICIALLQMVNCNAKRLLVFRRFIRI